MIYLKPDPNGLDYTIQNFQQAVYNGILKKWPSMVYESYGRCAAVRTPEGYVASVYVGGSDYRLIGWDDGSAIDALSFFGYTASKVSSHTLMDLMVHMVVMCDLSRLYPSATIRMDEEIKIEFMRVFQKVLLGFHFDSMELGMEKVFKEYRGQLQLPSMQRMDMHPLHCFRFNFLISYNPFQSNSLKL